MREFFHSMRHGLQQAWAYERLVSRQTYRFMCEHPWLTGGGLVIGIVIATVIGIIRHVALKEPLDLGEAIAYSVLAVGMLVLVFIAGRVMAPVQLHRRQSKWIQARRARIERLLTLPGLTVDLFPLLRQKAADVANLASTPSMMIANRQLRVHQVQLVMMLRQFKHQWKWRPTGWDDFDGDHMVAWLALAIVMQYRYSSELSVYSLLLDEQQLTTDADRDGHFHVFHEFTVKLVRIVLRELEEPVVSPIRREPADKFMREVMRISQLVPAAPGGAR